MNNANKSVWPVMITPFTTSGSIDYIALEALIDWYEERQVDGLFAVCQSSEMFYLSLGERIELASFIKRKAKIPVIASGHISYDIYDQLEELNRIADTGVDAVVLLTNRLAPEKGDSDTWLKNLDFILNKCRIEQPLGLYECPFPFKRLLSLDELAYCAKSGRFHFLKDTCCDINEITKRLNVIAGSPLQLYNANTSTLLNSYMAGGSGFSGVMANFHPELYVWLSKYWEAHPAEAEDLQTLLTMCSFIEKQFYPTNAKYHISLFGLPISLHTRSISHLSFTDTQKDEVRQMNRMIQDWKTRMSIE